MAILLVLIWHTASLVHTVPGTWPAYGLKLLSFAWAGVDLFFVLSGLLIGSVLLQNRTAPHYFKTFYFRRVCRIFPLYYLTLLIYGAAIALTTVDDASGDWWAWLFANRLPFWSYAVFLQNLSAAHAGTLGANWLGVTWSLAVEEQFYLLLPLMLWSVRADLLPKVLGLLVLSAPVVRTVLLFWYPNEGLPGVVLLPGRWDALLLGVLGAHALQQPAIVERLRRSLNVIRLIVVGATLMILALLAGQQGMGSLGMNAGGHTVIAILGLGLIGLAVLSDRGRTRALFRQPTLVWLGTVSYGVYLLHLPVAGLLHGVLSQHSPRIAGPADLLIAAFALSCTFLLATLSHRFLESPFIRAGRRMSYWHAPSLVRTQAPA